MNIKKQPINSIKYFKHYILIHIKRISTCILIFIAMYALLVSVFSIIPTAKEKTTEEKIAIYILSNEVHTDIVLPVNSTEINCAIIIPYTNTQKKDTTAKFIAFGWGDKGFYLKTPTWADLKFSKAFKASSGLGNSAIHTTLHYQLSESNNYKRILISSKHYLNLITYIKKTLKLDNEKPILINTNAN